MDNDPYEKTKSTYMETINKLREEKKEVNNKQKHQLDVIIEKPNIIKKNEINYNMNNNKYNYLNKYDKNWNLKKEEKEKAPINKLVINKPQSNQKKNRYRD